MHRVAASARAWELLHRRLIAKRLVPGEVPTILMKRITKVADAVLANLINQVQAHYHPYIGQTGLYRQTEPYPSAQLLSIGRTLDQQLQQLRTHSSNYSIHPKQTSALIPYSHLYSSQRPLSVRGHYQLDRPVPLVMVPCI
jgi:hypothetical protein